MKLEEDAAEMTRDEFIAEHGEYEVDIWDRINNDESKKTRNYL